MLPDDEELIKEQTVAILKSNTRSKKDLIPIMQEIQAKFGYLPRRAMLEVATFLRIPESSVYGVATFYNQFRFVPPGKHPIKVCLGTACHTKRGEAILDAWERELEIKVGKTTLNREFSLERVACVGCCALAPVTVVEEAVQGRMSPTRVKGILLSYKLKKEQSADDSRSSSADSGELSKNSGAGALRVEDTTG